MSLTFRVKIVDGDGNPVSGETVLVVESAITGPSQSQCTDSDGWAEFEFERNRLYAYVHVAGEEHHVIVDDGDELSFTI